jgi:putative ABC transport system ATP-binding protein
MIKIEGLKKEFKKGGKAIRALDGVDLSVEDGTWLTVTGASGSGKSTLLYSIGGLLKPTAGRVEINNTDIYGLSHAQRARFRGDKIGFIFQSFHLFSHLSVLDNVLVSGGRFRKDDTEAKKLLEKMGLAQRAEHMPSELSVGEKQRVAVARAVFSRPALILADEPTGNLDAQNGKIVVDYLKEFNSQGMSVIFVTHKPRQEFEAISTHIVMLENGTVVKQ